MAQARCLLARLFGLGALLRRRLQRGLEGGPLLLCALVIEQVAPGPALERPRHGLVAPGDVGVGGPLLRVAGSGGETRWVWVARCGACLRATPSPPSPNPPPTAGARGGYGLQSGGQSAKWGRGAPHGQTSATSAAALVVHEVLAQLVDGVRANDDATEEVRDLLPLGSLLCHMPNVRVWAGGQGGWARKNRAAGHAPIASSIECPDICRTPLGARRERRRKAIIAG